MIIDNIEKLVIKDFLSNIDNKTISVAKRTGISYYLVNKIINKYLSKNI